MREKNDSSLTSATFSGKQPTEEQQKQFSHQYLMPPGGLSFRGCSEAARAETSSSLGNCFGLI